MLLARLLAKRVLSRAAHAKQSVVKTFPDGVSPKRKKFEDAGNRWISGCTIVAQMVTNRGSLPNNEATHPNVTY